MRSRFYSLLFIFIWGLSYPLMAQQTSGMDFLNIGPNAYALSLSDAQTATLLGPSDLYTNPANLALEKRSSIGADYTFWILDTHNSHAAGNFMKGNHAFGFGVLSSQVNDLQIRDNPGPSDGSFSVGYLSLAGAYAFKYKMFSLGATAQFLSEDYLANRASGYAFNVGISSEWLNKRIHVGAAVLNMGRMNRLLGARTPLPTNARLGISAQLVEFTTPGDNDLPVLVALHADAVKPIEDYKKSDSITFNQNDIHFNIATSIQVADIFDLRAGYKTGNTERHVSFGAGFWVSDLLFNYSVVPFSGGYGTVHSIGVQYYFD